MKKWNKIKEKPVTWGALGKVYIIASIIGSIVSVAWYIHSFYGNIAYWFEDLVDDGLEVLNKLRGRIKREES